MGNFFSKQTEKGAEHPEVTQELVEEAREALQDLVGEQLEAVDAIIGWLEDLANDMHSHMSGSVCFAGIQGAAQQKCLELIGKLFWGEALIHRFDMRKYASSGCLFQFFEELKNFAYGHNVIVFNHIGIAHKEIRELVDQIVRHRSVARYYPVVFSNSSPNMAQYRFKNVIFVGLHHVPGFASLQPHAIVERTKQSLKGSAFDVVVPFRCRDPPASSSSSRKDSVRTKRAVPDSPAQEGQAQDQSPKRKKIHNTTINTNSNNNTTGSHNTTSDSHHTDSHNPTDSLNTTTTTHSLNTITTTKNSYNTNSSIPLELTNNATNPTRSATNNRWFPLRDKTHVEAFVDGEEYYSRLYQELTTAAKEILICGWMLSPVHLKRPHADNEDSNLFKVLKDAAARGVEVYILLRNADTRFVVNEHDKYKIELEKQANIWVSLQSRSFPNILNSHHQKFVIVDRRIAFVGGLDLAYNRWDTPQHTIVDLEGKFFPTGDFYHTDTKNISHEVDCRMGWHDVQVSVEGDIVSDLRETFVERWNADETPAFLMGLKDCCRPTPRASTVQCEAQLVRTIHGPTVGFYDGYVERDILDAYCQVITCAETFVYIENQYFILDMTKLRNAIINRIVAAAKAQRPFIMAIILPITPDNGGVDATVTQTIMVHQYESIKNLRAALVAHNIKPDQYIKLYGLMQHDTLNGKLVSSQIYVHSKIMISDSSSVVGSANINCRSLDGNGDSELAVVVHNKNFSESLVRKLLAEHSGEPVKGDICNFIAAKFSGIAAANYRIYQDVFGQLESKNAKAYVKEKESVFDHHNQLPDVKGHVISFPMSLLADQTKTRFYSRFNPVRLATS